MARLVKCDYCSQEKPSGFPRLMYSRLIGLGESLGMEDNPLASIISFNPRTREIWMCNDCAKELK